MAPSLSSQLQDEKRALRRVMAERRDALPADERQRLTREATARLLALPAFGAAATRTISGFVAIRGELDPADALAAARARGVVVVLPRVSDGSPRLRFHRADSPDELALGRFGLAEPTAAALEVPVENIDLMIVPGLAFDLAGRRLGYGGGYYDEVATRLQGRGVRVALGYDFQVVDRCPAGDADATVDWLVTDQRAVRCEGTR